MSVAGISSSSIAAAYTPPPAQPQAAKPPQQAPKVDTVTISKQALTLAKDGDTLAQEVAESGVEKASEQAKGKA